MSVDVSIVLPCLNESRTLPGCLSEARQALSRLAGEDGLRGEIVVADNGSTDGSRELAASLGAQVADVQRRGYGNALIGGIRQSHGRYIVIADADGSYDLLECVPLVRALVAGEDLCMGSRFRGTILPGAMPFMNRYLGNPLLTGVLNLLFRSGLSDAHCGMRAFTKDAFDRMHLAASGMEFASEMVIKATLLDLKRSEIPITLRPDGRDRPPHLHPFRDGWRHLRYILMLSPVALYFVPASVLGAFGILVLLLLLANRTSVVVDLGPVWFGDHWLVVASAMVVSSYQAAYFGVATTLYGIRSGYRRPSRWVLRLTSVLTLETGLLLGLVFLLVSLAGFLTIVSAWARGGFGQLYQLREMVAASTLGLLGIQTVFGSYLLATVSGNEADYGETM